MSLWSLPVLRLRALLRVLRPPPARVVEVAQRMTFEAVVWGNCGSGRGVFFLAKAGSQKWKEHETATYTKDCNCLPLNFDTFMWLDRFWLVQALLPESSLLSLLVSSSGFLTDNSSSFAFVTLVNNFLFKPRCMTCCTSLYPKTRSKFVVSWECPELGSEINARIV